MPIQKRSSTTSPFISGGLQQLSVTVTSRMDGLLPNGIVCTPEQYARSLQNDTIHCLTHGETIGLTLIAAAAFISLVALSYVFFIILRNVARRFRDRVSVQIWQAEVSDPKPIDILMFSLFFADLVQGIGMVMEFKWAVEGNLHTGSFCTAQGVLLQLGGLAVALTTLMIAVYTFLGIWIGKVIRSMRITTILVTAIWAFGGLIVIVGNTANGRPGKPRFESPTPYWCWIGQSYLQWGIWGQYFWYWLTLAFSIMLYVPLWLWSRGTISIDDNTWWKFKSQRSGPTTNTIEDRAQRASRRRSLVMLAYPLAYCTTILPLSVVRFVGFFHESTVRVPYAAKQAAFALFCLGGTFNVILLLTTRPDAVIFETYFYNTSPQIEQLSSPLLPSMVNKRQPDVEEEYGEENELGRLPSHS